MDELESLSQYVGLLLLSLRKWGDKETVDFRKMSYQSSIIFDKELRKTRASTFIQ